MKNAAKRALVAKIGVDTAENEQHFAEILPIGRRVADRRTVGASAARVVHGRRDGDPLDGGPHLDDIDRIDLCFGKNWQI